MHRRRPALCAILFLLSFIQAAFAHSPEGEFYFAFQFHELNAPIIDGDPTEWDIIPFVPFNIEEDRLYSGEGDAAGDDYANPNLDIRHLISWNDCSNKLYFLTQVYDNRHNADREAPSAYWQDDNWQVEINLDHTPTEAHNLEGQPINNISYIFAVPPVDGAYQFYRPLTNLPWLDDSKWVEFAWSVEPNGVGELYTYELAITPIAALPHDEAAMADEAVVHDLKEGEIIHISISVGDVDTLDSYQEFWSMSPEGSGTATNDVLLIPLDDVLYLDVKGNPIIHCRAATAAEGIRWGQIKSYLDRQLR